MKKVLLFSLTFILYRSFLIAQSSIVPNLNNWIITPQSVICSPDDPTVVNALANGTDFLGFTPIAAGTEKSIVVHLPNLLNAGMLTYSFESEADISGIIVDSYYSADGNTWILLDDANYHNERGEDLQKVDFPATLSNQWLKVVFRNTSTATRNLRELGLYQFNSTGLNQYFLIVGASITESAGRHSVWKQTINTRLEANYQPVVFNWAFSGDNTQGILNKLTSFLEQHPKAAYVMIDAGGNDITHNRPLTFSKSLVAPYTTQMSNTLAIIKKVKEAGKIPVLSRISFRNYVSPNAVNGGLNQELGSLPYNFDIDKIIKEETPQFWNESERRGYLDFYQFTLNNQQWLLSSDGTHFRGSDAFHIREFWVDYAYKYIYTEQRSAVVPYAEVVPNLTTLANNAVSIAENSHAPQDIWNARILVEQIANTNTRIALLDRLEGSSTSSLSITQNPSNITVANGSTASFVVTAIGTGTLSYQWQKNGQNIAGATAQSYSFTASNVDHGNLYRCVVTNGTNTATSASATLTVTTSGSGSTNGLTARYYSNVFSNIPNSAATLTRVDDNVNFSWGEAAPAANITPNAFAVRWSGKITPTATGVYTFYTQSNDGVKLSINNDIVINKWQYQALTEWSGTITLTAGVSYNIVLDFFEGNGDAICKLLWSGPGIAKQVVPSAVLIPESNTSTSPNITQQPNSISILLGETATFAIAASGTGPLSYQWRKNGVNIQGAVTSTYSYTPTIQDNGANFVVIVSNTSGSATSSTAMLTVTVPVSPAVITQEPQGGSYVEGDTIQLSVAATSTEPVTYQWQKNGVDILGATGSSYRFKASLQDHNQSFRVIVTNSGGSTISNSAVVLISAISTPPSILQQPISISLTQGSLATFSVVASSPAIISYQWLKNGNVIEGATSNIYTFAAGLLDHEAVYSVLVSNSAGTTPSQSVTLTVTPAQLPTIVLQPAATTVTDGDTAQFSVEVVGGTTPLSYQWQKNGTNIAGATQSSYRFKALLADHLANYRVVITNAAGSLSSDLALLTVNPSTVVHGLTAKYFSNVFASIPNSSPVLSRIDANINFAWGTASPGGTVSANAFAARWTGKIKVNSTGTYTFYTYSDDGARLWVNGQLIIDKWAYQGPTEWSGSISLLGGLYYDIKLEYFEGNGDATCKLSYSSATTPKAIVPSNILFPEGTGARMDLNESAAAPYALEAFPNPCTESINLKLQADLPHMETVVIENLQGQHIMAQQVELLEGINEITIATGSLQDGMYIVNMAGNKKIISKR